MKKVLNVFGIIFAFLFSLVLVCVLFLIPVWQSVSSLLQPEVLQAVVSEVVDELDGIDFTVDAADLTSPAGGEALDPALAQAVAESKTLQQAAPLLGEDLCRVVMGDFTATSLTAEELRRIGTENRSELVEILTLSVEVDGQYLTAEEAGAVVDQLIAQADALEAELTAAFLEMQTSLHTDYAAALELLTGALVPTVLMVTALILAVLIFLCRWPRQEGLLWLGIDFALAGLPVMGIALSAKGSQLAQTLAQGMGVPNVFSPVLRQATNTLLWGGVLLLGLAVLFIAGFVLLRDRRMKRQAAAQADAAAAPAPAPGENRSPWDNV